MEPIRVVMSVRTMFKAILWGGVTISVVVLLGAGVIGSSQSADVDDRKTTNSCVI